jgi:hypothetical protein
MYKYTSTEFPAIVDSNTLENFDSTSTTQSNTTQSIYMENMEKYLNEKEDVEGFYFSNVTGRFMIMENIIWTKPIAYILFNKIKLKGGLTIEKNSLKYKNKITSDTLFNNKIYRDYLSDIYKSDNRLGMVISGVYTSEPYVCNYDTNYNKYILIEESNLDKLIIKTNSIADFKIFFFNTNVNNWSVVLNNTITTQSIHPITKPVISTISSNLKIINSQLIKYIIVIIITIFVILLFMYIKSKL